MVLYGTLFLDMNADTMNDVLRPKVDGPKHLDELFSKPTLEFFILLGHLAAWLVTMVKQTITLQTCSCRVWQLNAEKRGSPHPSWESA